MFDVKSIRQQFPLLVKNPSLCYLDSTATSLKPSSVLAAINQYYQEYSANVFRGLYSLSEKATKQFEEVREKVARFINAFSAKEIIFVRNTTEAINLVVYSWGRININQGDEIITTIMEHHANFVPWQQLVFENQAILKIIEIDQNGFLKKEALLASITKKTKMVALTHASNVLGVINPVKQLIQEIKRINPYCLVLIDGAQAVPHFSVDVQNLGCDFYCFSGHKMLGPTGIGVLWGKKELLEAMVPFNFGGEMIDEVTLQQTTFKPPPFRFEAGTPHIAGVIGLGAAIDFLNAIGFSQIRKHEEKITDYALNQLGQLKNFTLYGPKSGQNRLGLLTFSIKGVHPHDVAQILNSENICIRSGHHCAMPLHGFLGVKATSRVSFYLYNTLEEVDKLIKGLRKIYQIFKLND